MRTSTDDILRERGRIEAELGRAFPGAEVTVNGAADARTNGGLLWLLRVTAGGQTVERAMRPDTPVAKAVEVIRKEFAETAALTTTDRGEA